MNGRIHLSSRFIPALLIALLGCGDLSSLANAAAEGAPCGEQGCSDLDASVGDGSAGEVSNDVGGDVASEAGTLVNPLCGTLACNPDDTEAAKCNDGGASPPDAGGGGTTDAAGDTEVPTGDAAGAESGSAAGADAANHMGGANVPSNSDDGGTPPYPPDENPSDPSFACQVTVDKQGDRVASCAPAGTGQQGDPCVTSADCAPGSTCIGADNTGVCRSYCCLEPEGCDPGAYAEGSYCSVGQMRDRFLENPDESFLVPVCVPANKCELVHGPGGESLCESGKICAVVRSDGTTACVAPGTAQEGEPCEEAQPGRSPCGEGLVCSKATSVSTCMKLCRVSAADACESGVCQAGTTSLPEGYGVCVDTRQK